MCLFSAKCLQNICDTILVRLEEGRDFFRIRDDIGRSIDLSYRDAETDRNFESMHFYFLLIPENLCYNGIIIYRSEGGETLWQKK